MIRWNRKQTGLPIRCWQQELILLIKSMRPHIQRHGGVASEGVDTAPASVDRALASPGRPLEPALRQDMESASATTFQE